MFLVTVEYFFQMAVLFFLGKGSFRAALPSVTFSVLPVLLSFIWLIILSLVVPTVALLILAWDLQGQKIDGLRPILAFHYRMMIASSMLMLLVDCAQDFLEITHHLVDPGLKYVFHTMLAPFFFIDVAYHRALDKKRSFSGQSHNIFLFLLANAGTLGYIGYAGLMLLHSCIPKVNGGIPAVIAECRSYFILQILLCGVVCTVLNLYTPVVGGLVKINRE